MILMCKDLWNNLGETHHLHKNYCHIKRRIDLFELYIINPLIISLFKYSDFQGQIKD